MRFAGRISGWNDAKGFGFVSPNGGGDRAFVHIKSFRSGSRRPVDGDLVSYVVSTDGQGRKSAGEVRFADNAEGSRKATGPLPRMMMGLVFLLFVAGGHLAGMVPVVVTASYVGLSALSFGLYALDKSAAGRQMQRTPEARLHLVDLVGGWPGGLIAQQFLRHKTVKASFQRMFWITVVLNVAGVAWLLQSGHAASLSASL